MVADQPKVSGHGYTGDTIDTGNESTDRKLAERRRNSDTAAAWWTKESCDGQKVTGVATDKRSQPRQA
jgi:hypothetical protein